MCPPAVAGQIEDVAGVKSCEVDYPTKTVTVEVEKGTDAAAVAAGLTGKFKGTVKDG